MNFSSRHTHPVYLFMKLFSTHEKHAEQEREIDKTGKDSAFKAAPLPSFYHRRSMSLRTDLPEVSDKMVVQYTHTYAHFKCQEILFSSLSTVELEF